MRLSSSCTTTTSRVMMSPTVLDRSMSSTWARRPRLQRTLVIVAGPRAARGRRRFARALSLPRQRAVDARGAALGGPRHGLAAVLEGRAHLAKIACELASDLIGRVLEV